MSSPERAASPAAGADEALSSVSPPASPPITAASSLPQLTPEAAAHDSRDDAGINSPRGGVGSRAASLLSLAGGEEAVGDSSSPAVKSRGAVEADCVAAEGEEGGGAERRVSSGAAVVSAPAAPTARSLLSSLPALPAGLLGFTGASAEASDEAAKMRLQVRSTRTRPRRPF